MADLGLLRTVAIELGDVDLFSDRVLGLHDRGKREEAREALLQDAAREKDATRAERQRRLARDPLLWAHPVRSAPAMFTLNGFGTSLYTAGQHKTGLLPKGNVWTGILWLTALFIPVVPLGAYLVTGSNPYHFHGRVPLPRWAWGVPAAWGGAFVLLFAFMLPLVWMDLTHTDVIVYNGFDEPIIVKIDEQGEVVQPHEHRRWSDVPAEPARFEAFAEDGRSFEVIDLDLTDHAEDTVIYNVASRGMLHLYWVRYGDGEPPADEFLPPEPVHFVDVDYIFTEAPEQKQVKRGSHIDDQVLEAMELGEDLLGAFAMLMSEGFPDHAEALLEAEQKLHPQDDRLRYILVQKSLAEAPDEQARAAIVAELRTQRDQTPDDVTSHRLFQDFGGVERAELLKEYEARLAQTPSAMAHYLVGRLRDGEPALAEFRAALALDAEYRPALRGVAIAGSELGAYEEAYAALVRHGSDGLDPETVDLAHHLARIVDAPSSFPQQGPVPPGLVLALESGQHTVEALMQELAPPLEVLPLMESELRLVTGELERVRELLQQPEAHRGPAIKLALSDGALETDRDRALALLGQPEQLGMDTSLQDRLFIWGFLARAAPDRLEAWQTPLRADPAFAALLDELGGVAGLRDPATLDKHLKGGVPLPVRGTLYTLGAYLHDDDDAGSAFRELARRFNLPLERPWFRR
jgi:hypothetical protein